MTCGEPAGTSELLRLRRVRPADLPLDDDSSVGIGDVVATLDGAAVVGSLPAAPTKRLRRPVRGVSVLSLAALFSELLEDDNVPMEALTESTPVLALAGSTP